MDIWLFQVFYFYEQQRFNYTCLLEACVGVSSGVKSLGHTMCACSIF